MTSEPTPRWKTDTFVEPRLCAITDELLYLVDDDLYAVHTESGEEVWQTRIETGTRIDATRSNVFVRRPNDAGLRCLAAFDGVEVWQTELSGRFSYLLANEKNVIAPTHTGDGQGVLEAVHVDSGERDWSRTYTAPVAAISPISNGIVFIDTDQRVSLIDDEGGIERWSNGVDEYIHSHVAHDGRLYIGHASGLEVIDLQTGIERYRIKMDHGVRTMEPVDGGVITGATDGTVSMVDDERGDVDWSVSLSDPITALAEDRQGVYAGNRAGTVVCLNPADGEREWDTATADAIQDLVLHETTLCGQVSDGSTVGLGSSSGEHRWRLTVDESTLAPRIEVRGEDMYLYTSSTLASIDSVDGSVQWKHDIDDLLFGEDCVYLSNDGAVVSLPLLPDATTRFIDDRDEDDDSMTRIWRGD